LSSKEAAGSCYDVLDGPDGDDLAPCLNQLLAISLPHSPLTERQQRVIVDVCARQLPTSHGPRSLASDDPAYIGHYGSDQQERDAAYHQDAVWGCGSALSSTPICVYSAIGSGDSLSWSCSSTTLVTTAWAASAKSLTATRPSHLAGALARRGAWPRCCAPGRRCAGGTAGLT